MHVHNIDSDDGCLPIRHRHIYDGQQIVAIVTGDYPPGTPAGDRMEALARLFAAAPDLLAACVAIVSGWGHQDGVSKAVELARAAIAKAKS